MFRGRAHRLHFVGIGGIGMSGIAEVLLTLGYDIRGSDMSVSSSTQRLANMGVQIFKGHVAEHVKDADVVVISSAIKADNPEVCEARARGIPIIRRADMLAELMRLKYGIAVAGMHGKTTTTSLIASILDHAGFDPTMVVGGRLKSIDTNARLGAGEYLVAEADESDGTFLHLMPTIAVVTNIDEDHLDHWRGGLKDIVDAFVAFVNKVPFYGAAILCLDHPTVQQMLPRLDKRCVTYGLNPQADYVAENLEAHPNAMTFDVRRANQPLGRVHLKLIGEHNVLNALASIAVADEVGVPFATSAEALQHFAGIGRRFEHKGTINDIMFVDDYGHHPAEIRATLTAARAAHTRRLVVVFQPHRYTRTRDLLDDFAISFHCSNILLIADIYPAGEAPIDNINSTRLADAIRACGHRDVHATGSLDDTLKKLVSMIQPGDLVITLGAGNVYKIGEDALVALAC